MARWMRLFLVRHGETIDNVAGNFAGSTDSGLTNHGYQQATRLGLHMKARGLLFTHFFSSHLQRAATTASKIREAQLLLAGKDCDGEEVPHLVQLPILMEQDFGSMEGKRSFPRLAASKMAGKEHYRQTTGDSAGFVDVESKEAMARRADAFLDQHILPLFCDDAEVANPVIAIVSHGIFLSTLWKRLLLRLPAKSVALSAELQATARPSLEHLGGWSNTGFLELRMLQTERDDHDFKDNDAPAESMVILSPVAPGRAAVKDEQGDVRGEVALPKSVAIVDARATPPPEQMKTPPVTPSRRATSAKKIRGWTTTIEAINSKDHLKGMKRTGGRIGSSRYDSSQKSIETFFKRRKTE